MATTAGSAPAPVTVVEFLDDDGDPYFWNSVTEETSRERPTGPGIKIVSEADYLAEPAVVGHPHEEGLSEGPDDWQEFKDEAGQPYFWSPSRGVSAWSRPVAAAAAAGSSSAASGASRSSLPAPAAPATASVPPARAPTISVRHDDDWDEDDSAPATTPRAVGAAAALGASGSEAATASPAPARLQRGGPGGAATSSSGRSLLSSPSGRAAGGSGLRTPVLSSGGAPTTTPADIVAAVARMCKTAAAHGSSSGTPSAVPSRSGSPGSGAGAAPRPPASIVDTTLDYAVIVAQLEEAVRQLNAVTAERDALKAKLATVTSSGSTSNATSSSGASSGGMGKPAGAAPATAPAGIGKPTATRLSTALPAPVPSPAPAAAAPAPSPSPATPAATPEAGSPSAALVPSTSLKRSAMRRYVLSSIGRRLSAGMLSTTPESGSTPGSLRNLAISREGSSRFMTPESGPSRLASARTLAGADSPATAGSGDAPVPATPIPPVLVPAALEAVPPSGLPPAAPGAALPPPIPLASLLSFLKSAPVFHSLSEEQLSKLGMRVRRIALDAGTLILRQGDPAQQFFYLIEEGTVRVHVRRRRAAAGAHAGGSTGGVGAPLRSTSGSSFRTDEEAGASGGAGSGVGGRIRSFSSLGSPGALLGGGGKLLASTSPTSGGTTAAATAGTAGRPPSMQLSYVNPVAGGSPGGAPGAAGQLSPSLSSRWVGRKPGDAPGLGPSAMGAVSSVAALSGAGNARGSIGVPTALAPALGGGLGGGQQGGLPSGSAASSGSGDGLSALAAGGAASLLDACMRGAVPTRPRASSEAGGDGRRGTSFASSLAADADDGTLDYVAEAGETGEADIDEIEALGPVTSELTRGMFFGGGALLGSGFARAASCMAATPVTALVIERADLADLGNVSGVVTYLTEHAHAYELEAPEALALARHVHSYRVLLNAAASEGTDLDEVVRDDADLSPTRALVEVMALFSPELSVPEIIGRVRRVLTPVVAAGRVEVALVDPKKAELLVASPAGKIAPEGSSDAASSSKPTGMRPAGPAAAAGAASTPSTPAAPPTPEVADALAAVTALGGKPVGNGYVRLPLARCGALGAAVLTCQAIESTDVRVDERFVAAPEPSSGATAPWLQEQGLLDRVMGMPAGATVSLLASPVIDGRGRPLAVLLVINKAAEDAGDGGFTSEASTPATAGAPKPPPLGSLKNKHLSVVSEMDGDEDCDDAEDGIDTMPESAAFSSVVSGRSEALSLSSAGVLEDGDGGAIVGGRRASRRLTSMRTWTLHSRSSGGASLGAGPMLPGGLPSPGADGGAGASLVTRKSWRASEGGATITSRGSARNLLAGMSASSPSTASGAGGGRGSAATSWTPRDEAIIVGMTEALSHALDDRRVELETLVGTREFTPLATVFQYFRVQIGSLTQVSLSGLGEEEGASPTKGGSSNAAAFSPVATAGSTGGGAGGAAGARSPLLRGGPTPPPATGAAAAAAAHVASLATVPAPGAKELAKVVVHVTLYHGGHELQSAATDAAPLLPSADTVSTFSSWNTNVALLIRWCNLPVATRVIFNVLRTDGAPIGWAGCTLFTAQQVLRMGAMNLPLWPGRCTPESVTRMSVLSNSGIDLASKPHLSVSFHQFEKSVVRLGSSVAPAAMAPDKRASLALTAGLGLSRSGLPGGLPASPSSGPAAAGPAAAAAAAAAAAGSVGGAAAAAAAAALTVQLLGADGNPLVNLVSQTVTAAEWEVLRPRLMELVRSDPLTKLTREDVALLWRCREFLTPFPAALPKFLQAVQWDDAASVDEAHRLLLLWRPPSPLEALALLQADFADPTVRAYAVSRLEILADEELHTYMLQLTQVLKFEPFLDSSLTRFLLRRALRRPRLIGHVLYWYLKAEMHVPEVSQRYGAILQQYLMNCEEHRLELGHQMFVMGRLESIAMAVKAAPTKEERLGVLRSELPRIVFPQRFQLPLTPHMVATGLLPDQCRVMSSKKLPLWLVFSASEEDAGGGGGSGGGGPGRPASSKAPALAPASGPRTLTVLYKAGDDLRQDQLTLQILHVMDTIWQRHDLDMRMLPYMCVSTGDEMGMIEVVLNSKTLAQIVEDQSVDANSTGIGRKFRAALGAYREEVYKDWLAAQPGQDPAAQLDNFMRSCAGYCVATYVLGIGDRHNDNIMLARDGRLFHIDFGHILGNFKYKLGYKRERAPFVFTPGFAAVLGGVKSETYRAFETLCCRAYNVLRAHGHLLINLFFLMLCSGLPELQKEHDLNWLRDKLMLDATDDAAAEHFKKQLKVSVNTRATQMNDAIHLLKHV